jgi:hypothetical protein
MSDSYGNTKHGGCGTLTYARWKSMMQRCSPTNAVAYPNHAGRGITVCERWQYFPSFLTDMGECPGVKMTMDRLDNDKDYEPGNCQWATKADQNRNRSYCVMLTHNGITRNITDWAIALGVRPQTLTMRLRLGWTPERALTQPIKPRTFK